MENLSKAAKTASSDGRHVLDFAGVCIGELPLSTGPWSTPVSLGLSDYIGDRRTARI